MDNLSIGKFNFESEEEYARALAELKLVQSIAANYDVEKPEMADRLLKLVKSGELRFETVIGRAFLKKISPSAEIIRKKRRKIKTTIISVILLLVIAFGTATLILKGQRDKKLERLDSVLSSFLTWTTLQYAYHDDAIFDGISAQEAIPMAAYSLESEYRSAVNAGYKPDSGEFSENGNTFFISGRIVEERARAYFGSDFSCDAFNPSASYSGVFLGEDNNVFILLGNWGDLSPKYEVLSKKGGIWGKDFTVNVRYYIYNSAQNEESKSKDIIVTYKCRIDSSSENGFVIYGMSGERG